MDLTVPIVFLSATCPVFAAPAMDLEMYRDDATQHNLETLRQRFRGEVVADLLCYLRIVVELTLRAKGVLWLDRICGGALLTLAGSLALYRRSA